jgi:hypothetical protein
MEKASRFKTQMTQNVRSGVTGNQKSNFKEIFVIAKNKLNQAVPLSMKVTLIYEHECNELFFVGRLYNQELYENFNAKNPTPGVPAIINFNMKVCYVLTNLDFIVQYYTPNANTFLGFKVGSNGNVDITKNITECGNNDDNLETKKLSKGELLCRRYAEPKQIIWKTLLNEEINIEDLNTDTVKKWDMKGFWSFSRELSRKKEQTELLEQTLLKKTQQNGNPFLFKRQRYKEDSFKLSVKQTSIKGTVLGYIFRFEVYDNIDEADANGFDEKNNELKASQLVKNLDSTYVPSVTRKFALDTDDFGFYTKEWGEEEEMEDRDSDGDIKNWHDKLKELAEKKINRFRERQKAIEDAEEDEDEEEEEDSEVHEDEENEESDMYNNKGTYSKGPTLNKQMSTLSNESGGLSRPGTLSKDKFNRQESHTNNPNNKKHDYKESSTLNENPLNTTNNNINTESTQNIVMPQQEKKVKFEYDYYHVKGLNNMRFLIYDFKKGRLIDVPKIKRESQVEYKKKEGIPNFIGGPPKEKVEREGNDEEEEPENETAEVKRIEYALQKEQFQPEIVILKYISFSIYAALMAISIILLILIISNYKEIKEIILIINNSRILQTDFSLGLYYVRELTLLSMNEDNEDKKYKTNLYNKEFMINNITATLNELFDRSSLLERSLESTSIEWSQNRHNILISNDTNIIFLGKQLEVIQVKSKAFSAITELLGNLFQVTNSKSNQTIQTNTHVYFYTTNMINPLLDILNSYIDNLILQLDNSIASFKKNFLLVLIFAIIILIVGGVVLKLILDKISRRKSGYLEVFFQIDNKVCKKALDKCDKYSKLLHPSQDGDDDSIMSENDSFIKKNLREEKKNNNIEHKKIQPTKSKKCINIKTAFQIGILFMSVFLYYLVTIILFEMNLNSMNDYSKIYTIISSESIEYQSMFDILREYFFDYKSYTGNTSYKDILISKFLTVYENQKTKEESFSFEKLPSKFKKKYLEVTSNDLCHYGEDLFTKNMNISDNHIFANNYQCHTLTDNSTQYGLNLLISFYLAELRNLKNFFDKMLADAKDTIDRYNNTLFGTDKYEQLINPDNDPNFNQTEYDILDPFNIFNEEQVFQISMIRRYFLLPIYNDTLNEFYKSMNTFWGTSYDIFLAVMVILLLLITTFYLAYWIPSIYSIDEDIYKTKNMLSIIPKDVLATIPGINKLLNLGNVTLFSGVWNQSQQKDKKKKKAKNKQPAA